jgi:RHS repeat-associated protein
MSVEGGAPTYFAWAGGKIIAEYGASGANALVWKTSYVYLGGQLLATTSGEDGRETRFHHPDRLGTRLVTDAAGTVVSEQLSMPFGNMLPFTQAYGGENSYQHPTLSSPSKKRFTTYDRSEATGLDYAVNRHYSSAQGRFTQVDPIGMGAAELADPQSLNLYAYVENDPINSSDPLGLDGTIVFGPFPVPTGGGGGGGELRIGPFSFSFGGGSFLNFGSLQQSKKGSSKGKVERIVGGVGDLGIIVVSSEPPDIGVKVGGGGGVPGASNASDDEVLDALQHTLDTIGLVPGFGEPADFMSAVLSGWRGDYIGVTLSLAAMIPVAGMLATYAKFARRAAKVGVRVASGVGGSAPMIITRIIKRGEKLDDIISEGKALTWTTGNEHALVTLANGQRAIVSGGPGGIDFAEGQITRIWGHTHPDMSLPSKHDVRAIRQLGNSQQTVFTIVGGKVTKVRR